MAGVMASALAAVLLSTSPARGQIEAVQEGIEVGAWTFYPSVALRLRGEYRRNPVDVGGNVYQRTAVDADGYQSSAPTVLGRAPAVGDQWLLAERSRLGVAVRHDVLTAALTLQDARVAGVLPGAPDWVQSGGFGALAPHEAYLDVRSNFEDPWLRVRLGRQRVVWGVGNLVGDSEWSARGGAIDAARALFTFGDVDIECLAAMLSPPGAVPPPLGATLPSADPTAAAQAVGTGAQLYGLRARWQIVELLGIELGALGRIAREPLPPELAAGDTYVLDGRVAGERRGVSYSAEGAYQLGRVASYGVNRRISAYAAAARVSWQTALPGDFELSARGAYASGDDSAGQGETLGRFDPLVSDVHGGLGQMDLFGWSNEIAAGGEVSARPLDDLKVVVGYTFAALAEPSDRWSTGALVAVGASADNAERVLGHELDARLSYAPLDGLRFTGGYGLFIVGAGAEAVIGAAGRGGSAPLHYALLQAELAAP